VADPLYLTDDGVRRIVAFREAGEVEIRAFLEIDGVRGPEFMVQLDQLYSRKDRVPRVDRWRRYLSVEAGAATPAGRAALPAIQLVPLSATRAKYFTPVADVILVL
jgi:hypothetical protein